MMQCKKVMCTYVEGWAKIIFKKRKDDFDLSNSRLLLFYKTENFFSPTLPENLSDFNVQVGPN